MKPVQNTLRYVVNKLDRLLLVCSGVSGGLALAQFPQFLAQYLQRLGGHADEARMAATQYGLSELGRRAALLSDGLESVRNAPPILKLIRFLSVAQWDIAREAWKNYVPGMTYNQEGLCYMGAGCLIGILLYGLIKGISLGGYHLIKRLRTSSAPPNKGLPG